MANHSTNSVTAMDELGIDIRAQRSTQLTPELVAEMDYIFGLAHGRGQFGRYFPQARRRFFTAGICRDPAAA